MRKKVFSLDQIFRTTATKVKTKSGGWIIMMAMVLTKRVKVANELYKKSDDQLLTAGQLYVSNMAANVFTPTPDPTLLVVSSAITDFSAAVLAAATGGKPATEAKNTAREVLLNLLSSLGTYVESVANDPANVATGPVFIIESCGMRAKTFTLRGRQVWSVERGMLSGTLELRAPFIRRGIHEWEYTTNPTDDTSWIALPSTLKAFTEITGLTRGSFVSCRHRSITKAGTSDWEGHDPVVVA